MRVRKEAPPSTNRGASKRSGHDTEPTDKGTTRTGYVAGTAYGRAVLASCLDAIETAPVSARHRSIYAAAARVGNVLAASELHSEDAARTALTAVAVRVLWDRKADAIRTVRGGIAKGMTTPTPAPAGGTMLSTRGEAVAAVWEWWDAIGSHEWSDRSGMTSLRILAGFAMLARRAGKVRIEASYRQVAEAAGVPVSAVARTRRHWQGWVRIVRKGDRYSGNATVWQLIYQREGVAQRNRPEAYVDRISGLFHCATSCGDPKATSSPGDPAFDGWDRWPSGWRVWCCLEAVEARTPREIADATGLHRSTVYRTLHRLRERGLANRSEDGWTSLEPSVFVHPAARDRRRKRHEKDRKERRDWLKVKIDGKTVDRATGEVLSDDGAVAS